MRKIFRSIIHPHPDPPLSRGRESFGDPLLWRGREDSDYSPPSRGREIGRNLIRARRGFGCLLILLLLSSCATVDYLPPEQGTSAELQSILAASLEENLKEILFDPSGKTVDISVRALGSFQTSRGVEKYGRSLFQEWVVKKGGQVGPGQFRMEVFLPVLGTTATRRDLSYNNIPLYYSERFRASGQLIVLVKDRDEKVVGVWRGGKGDDRSDIYLLRIFGPFDLPL